jgi:hypothetical protein
MVLWVFMSLSFIQELNAQELGLLSIWTDEGMGMPKEKRFKTKKSLNAYLIESIQHKKLEGHPAASLDSLVSKDQKNFIAYLYSGPQYIIRAKDSIDGKAFSLIELQEIARKERSSAENSGHPFSREAFMLIPQNDTIYYAKVGQKGKASQLDSIVQLGDKVMDAGALAAHLRLKKGQLYKEDRLRKVDARLKRLLFLRVVRPSELIFTEDAYRLLLSIEKKKANTANGILGFQPDEDGKVRTTGEVDLVLQNALNRADRISFNWRRLQDASQKLEVALTYPYLFRSPLGILASLDQFRQDSTFNQVESELGLSLLLDNGDVLQVDVGNRTFANLLSEPSSLNQTDSRSTLYSLGYSHNSLDDQFNTYHGAIGGIKVAYGNKTLTSQSSSEESVKDNFDSWEISFDLRNFFPITKRSTLMLRMNAFHQESEIILYKELQRLGGLFTLRGMDELSIRASTFGVLTTEYRYLTAEQAYVSVFVDLGYYEANAKTYSEKDRPYGFGLGAAFDTGSGIFTLNYALGSRFDSALTFRTGKLHFGYTALF